ncbi:MAG: DUF1840 domain-containing protein [Verrucomicrobiales bacterium]|nr:DUF1840 domain-containing protein [Verrucomicrobiales bacterium]
MTFRSKAYADLVMFSDIAVRLIKLMGHSGTVPGAILAEDIDAALARLKNAIAAEKAVSGANEPRERNEDGSEPPAGESCRPCLATDRNAYGRGLGKMQCDVGPIVLF